MSSFWKSNDLVATWSAFIPGWWSSSPPRLIMSNPMKREYSMMTGYTIRKATQQDILQIPNLWSRFYSTSNSYRCVVPIEHIEKQIENLIWDVYVAVSDSMVIGTLIRRWIPGFFLGGARWSLGGVVDYYCVHPAYRKKGVGRNLLTFLHNETQRPMPPHIMLWEGVQVSVPPLIAGILYSKECFKSSLQTSKVQENKKQIWGSCVKGDCWSDISAGIETDIWDIEGSYVIVTNTMHKTIPEGKSIGMVIAHSGSFENVNRFSQASGHDYGVLLYSSILPVAGWSFDSAFTWLGYNLQNSQTQTRYPCLWY